MLGWLAINLFFIGVNVLGAALIFGLFRLGQILVPSLMEEPFFVYPLGILAIGLTIWCASLAMRLMARLAQGRGRGRV